MIQILATMATQNDALHAKLDAHYATMQKLTLESPAEDFAAFGAFFNEECTVYLMSMREYAEPSLGRQAAIAALRENLNEIRMVERRVLSRSVTTNADGSSTVFHEMKNHLVVCGDVLDPFYETAVVHFDKDGLITEFKLYSCRSHIVMLIQEHTGVGPYEKHTGDGPYGMVDA